MKVLMTLFFLIAFSRIQAAEPMVKRTIDLQTDVKEVCGNLKGSFDNLNQKISDSHIQFEVSCEMVEDGWIKDTVTFEIRVDRPDQLCQDEFYKLVRFNLTDFERQHVGSYWTLQKMKDAFNFHGHRTGKKGLYINSIKFYGYSEIELAIPRCLFVDKEN